MMRTCTLSVLTIAVGAIGDCFERGRPVKPNHKRQGLFPEDGTALAGLNYVDARYSDSSTAAITKPAK